MMKIMQSILPFLTLADRKLRVRLNTEISSLCRTISWYNYFLFLCIMHSTHYHLHYYATVHLTPVFIQFTSVTQSCPTLCNPIDCSMPGLPVHHQLKQFTQTQVHWVSDAIQPSHPLLATSPAFNLSQHQGLFRWVSSLHQVAKVLEFQLQHQSFQWIFRTDFL